MLWILRAAAAALTLIMATAALASSDIMTASQRREEVAIVRKEYVDKAPEFDAAARRRANVLLDRLTKEAAAISDQQYVLRLSEITAQADNGHDNINLGRQNSPLRPGLRLPIRMIWLGDELYVARAARRYGDLTGKKVLRIGVCSTDELAAKLRRYQGGVEAYRRWTLGWLVHNPSMLKAMGCSKEANRTTIQVGKIETKPISRSLEPIAVEQMPVIAFPAGWISPILSPDEQAKGWSAAGNASAVPLYLQGPDRYFRMLELPRMNALYVQFRSNFDQGDEKIAPFVSTVEQRLASGPPRNLVLDLRFDTGGDNTQNRELMRHLAQKVPGHIFVLTGPYTFSAGIASAAAIIHDGGSKVVQVGEEPGDRAQWWSEHEPVCLPYSKICVDREMGRWDLVRGCAGKAHCYGDQFDIRVANLKPSIEQRLTAAEWLSGRDPLMDRVVAMLTQERARYN